MNKILNFERILCPVAQSHETDEGLRYAIALARSYGARLSVLTCKQDPRTGDETVAGDADRDKAGHRTFIRFVPRMRRTLFTSIGT